MYIIYIYVYELVLKRWKFCQVIWASNRWLKWAIQPWFPMHIQRKAKQVSTWLSSHRGKNFWVPPNLNLETSMAIQPSIVHLHAFFLRLPLSHLLPRLKPSSHWELSACWACTSAWCFQPPSAETGLGRMLLRSVPCGPCNFHCHKSKSSGGDSSQWTSSDGWSGGAFAPLSISGTLAEMKV